MRFGVKGCRGFAVAVFVCLKSTEKALWGERGELTTSEGGERGEEDSETIDVGLAAGGSDRCSRCVAVTCPLAALLPAPAPTPLLPTGAFRGLGTLNGVPLPFKDGCRGVTGLDWPASCALPSCSNLVRKEEMGLIDVVSGPSPRSAILMCIDQAAPRAYVNVAACTLISRSSIFLFHARSCAQSR